MATKILFHIGTFIGLCLLWMLILTILKYVFYIPIKTEVEIAISLLAVISSAFLSYPLELTREV
jgi:hypothetical protein